MYLFVLIFFLKILFIYLFLAVVGLHCFVGFSLVVANRGFSLPAGLRLLIAVASHCRAWALGCAGFSSCICNCGSRALEHRLDSCDARAYLLRVMWNFP